MKYRKLRIAWSVGCGILCLLLIALWVRSYWKYDFLDRFNTSRMLTSLESSSGRLRFGLTDYKTVPAFTVKPHAWSLRGYGPERVHENVFSYESNSLQTTVGFPHWLPVLIAALLSVTPWLHWRFSLRTLLIGMTVVAILLGLTLWASRGS
jgi:hypothetical protein